MKQITLLTLILLLVVAAGCCTITVPVETQTSKRELATKLAADIKNLQTTGQLEVNYKSAIDTSYVKLEQDTIVLMMWLQAARCESAAGKPRLAAQIYQFAYDTYNGRNRSNPLPPTFDLSRTETPGLQQPTPDELKALTDQLVKTLDALHK